jgi:methylenetetrahydrofolate--tRNA-(uracil-5-)-methyltransferase
LKKVNILGGGLAGCEAAWRIASSGIEVDLWEMRPEKTTPVHQTSDLAELVCSNSLKSELENTAQGLLKKEMRTIGSLLLWCADKARVPAGSALAVDRNVFAGLVTDKITSHPNIRIIRQEAAIIPEDGICIIATGPLTSETLSQQIALLGGEENLYFFDAIAPSVTEESIDKTKAFKASRYGKGTDDYYNCPLSKAEYQEFYENLIDADIKEGHSIDKNLFFSGCMPIEIMARRGKDTLRYGPMRPVGLTGCDGDDLAYAVLQLRQEDKAGQIYGLVGFQTRLRWGEQDRILRLIPALKNAEFVRYGAMHRNTYINSPNILKPTLQFKGNERIFFAGQITGVEGYMESAATGIIAGINVVNLLEGKKPLILSVNTMLGALIDFITHSNAKNFQPVNANFGLLPPLTQRIRNKVQRYEAYTERALTELNKYSELFMELL